MRIIFFLFVIQYTNEQTKIGKHGKQDEKEKQSKFGCSKNVDLGNGKGVVYC